MATYATYRHVDLDGIGRGKKRVLKPPGGGSSIMFDEPDGFHYRSPKTASPVVGKLSSATNGAVITTSKSDSGMSSGSVSPTPSGSITPSSSDNSGPSSISSTPAPSSPQSKAPVLPERIESPAKSNELCDSPFPEISQIKLDDVPTRSPASLNNSEAKSPTNLQKPIDLETPSTPGSKPSSPDTKGRLFGDENRTPTNTTPSRVIKDRMKSSIFVYQDESPSYAQQKPITPEPKSIEQLPSVAAPRQRIPPGGFSTKLW